MSRPVGPIPLMFYVACSWCWCIGMFFPVFLTGDFGWPGWVVFAIPNVIGAASVGFVLRSPEAARGFLERRRVAVAWFSIVTVLFHVSFLSWFPPTPVLSVERWMLGLVCLGLTALFAFLSFARAAMAAIVLWVVSVGFEIAAGQTSGAGFVLPASSGALPASGLALMAPVIVLGFLACPFLDATLLEARARAGDRGRLVFGVGYGVLFLVLILITLSYAGRGLVEGRWSYYTYGHVVLQACFTMGVHVRALRRLGVVRFRPIGRNDVDLAMLAVIVAGVTLLLVREGWSYTGLSGRGLTASRVIYDTFMSAYGLVFPAVMACVAVPVMLGRRGSAVLMWAAIVLGGPMMWLAAMEGYPAWYAAATGVVVAGGIRAIRRGRIPAGGPGID